MNRISVGVVGAGISGLACAGELARQGHRVEVFEKSRGTGGRCATRRVGELAFDHGAQYFTARDPRFRSALDEWLGGGCVAPWTGRVRTLEAGVLGRTSGEMVRYVGVPGMSAIGRRLARGLDVRLEQPVARIEFRDGWWLELRDGGRAGPYHALVLAAPAPQARALLGEDSPLAAALDRVRMQACQAALLVFEDPFDPGFDGAFVSHSALSWVARQRGKPERSGAESWILHATPEWSERHLETAPTRVVAELVEALGKALGRPLPGLRYRAAHRWLYSQTTKALGADCAFHAASRLGACGDWCLGGRVEGAWLSGRALADEISRSLG